VKVGDLVVAIGGKSFASACQGIVLSIKYSHAGQYLVTCLWADGEVDSLEISDLEVISEGG